MKNYLTEENIVNTLDFLILLETNKGTGEALKGNWKVAQANKVPLYTLVSQAMKNLGYIEVIGNTNKIRVSTFKLEKPQKEHAVKLIKELVRLSIKNQKKSKKKAELKKVKEVEQKTVQMTDIVRSPSINIREGQIITTGKVITFKAEVLLKIIEVSE